MSALPTKPRVVGENTAIQCEASGKILKLKKARKYNQGGMPCEECQYRKKCNIAPKVPEK